MRLVKPSVEFLWESTQPDIDVLKEIESAARTCWKSEHKVADGSAEKFVQKILELQHEAMIEHSWFVLGVETALYEAILTTEDRTYLQLTNAEHNCLVSGNARAFREFCAREDVPKVISDPLISPLVYIASILFEDLPWDGGMVVGDAEIYDGPLSKYEQLRHQAISYRIICNRGVTHELVRHRPFSYAQESTRYCNYGGGVTFIIPPWIESPPNRLLGKDVDMYDDKLCLFDKPHGVGALVCRPFEVNWLNAMQSCEAAYQRAIKNGWKPQQARGILPVDLKTEIVVTGNLKQWLHFFKLRHSPKAHPQTQEIAAMLLEDIKKRIPNIFDGVKYA